MSPSFFRRKYLNDKPFQISFILYSWCMAGFVILTVYFGIYSFFRRSFDQLQEMGLPPNSNVLNFLNEQQQMIRLIFILSFLVIFICMGFFGLILSHKVAGPLSKVRKQFKAMARGENVSVISFRGSDFFQDLADDINAVAARLPENSSRRPS